MGHVPTMVDLNGERSAEEGTMTEMDTAHLPESMRDLVAVGFPLDAVEGLINAFGGLSIRPTKLKPKHFLIEALGLEAARALCTGAGGRQLDVPRGWAYQAAAMHEAIRVAFDQGATVRELARKYQRTERQVRRILNGS